MQLSAHAGSRTATHGQIRQTNQMADELICPQQISKLMQVANRNVQVVTDNLGNK